MFVYPLFFFFVVVVVVVVVVKSSIVEREEIWTLNVSIGNTWMY